MYKNCAEWQNARDQLISCLSAGGFETRNGHGNDVIGLHTIQQNSIKVSDAFVFLPDPTLAEVFKLISLIVGYQTDDPELKGKPTIVVNLDNSWKPVFDILDHLFEQGMMIDRLQLFTAVGAVNDVVVELTRQIGVTGSDNLQAMHAVGRRTSDEVESQEDRPFIPDTDSLEIPKYNVGVFCSASTNNGRYKAVSYNLGRSLAQGGHGVVFGAGTTGMMGEIMRGVLEHGGYARGSNVNRIAKIEGVPFGLARYWGAQEGINDIYQRVAVMVEHSDAFLVLPGGAGTLQELLVLLLLLREYDSPLMRTKSNPKRNKGVVIVNTPMEGSDQGFYQLIIDLVLAFGYQRGQEFHVVENEFEAIRVLQMLLAETTPVKARRSWIPPKLQPKASRQMEARYRLGLAAYADDADIV